VHGVHLAGELDEKDLPADVAVQPDDSQKVGGEQARGMALREKSCLALPGDPQKS
jgi:hypothetical protein